MVTTSENAAPAEMPGVEEIARLEHALRYAATTASNDDYTKAGTVERTRHVDRVTAMLEAADALRAFAPTSLSGWPETKKAADDPTNGAAG